MNNLQRLPRHIGIIPDGNRRWAVSNGLQKQDGYAHGVEPGLALYDICLELGIEEITFYGFTVDNTKRPAVQTRAFQKACVGAVMSLAGRDAGLLVVGNTESDVFPRELLPYTKRVRFGTGRMKLNFLVNYGWDWDLNSALKSRSLFEEGIAKSVASSDISRIDMIVRWGGHRRLSGFLPLQSVYADFFVVDEMWPDFRPEQFYKALEWYQTQEVTLGG
jgi:undecaprenyl diphosphate synthase